MLQAEELRMIMEEFVVLASAVVAATATLLVSAEENATPPGHQGEEQPSTSLVRVREPRLFLQRTNLDDMEDHDVKVHFRLSRHVIHTLYALLEAKIEPKTRRSQAVPGMTRLLTTLYILGRGSFQTTSALVCGLSQPTVSRVFMQVINAIVDLVPSYIHFPDTAEEWRNVKEDFFREAGFPNILGAIDCTHVAIQAPIQGISFRNRKQYDSLNVQIVCDANRRIMSARTGFPGSCHDAYILRQTALYQKFISGEMPEGWLIGDKGYGQLPWLMTPVRHPRSQAEHNYNKALHKSRGIVEQTIGLLKTRFLCLARPGGELLYAPWKAARIIMACCVLHNLCVHHEDTWDIPEEIEPEVHQHPASSSETTAEGRRVRDELIANVFARKYSHILEHHLWVPTKPGSLGHSKHTLTLCEMNSGHIGGRALCDCPVLLGGLQTDHQRSDTRS
ncbi:putative nuclease HARBI1 [Pyxicephalus adspersus]|uniref:putative nuclease HARBI1 n=1 Tax=Pyxicephalus adspersus TaxID=30357 RepID=UPI003B5BE8BA